MALGMGSDAIWEAHFVDAKLLLHDFAPGGANVYWGYRRGW